MTPDLSVEPSPNRQQAWQDWRRVEACLLWGVRQWGWTVLALLAADHWLRPISWWLDLFAAGGILFVHDLYVKRLNAMMKNS